MRIQFDPNQTYQIDAINAVVDLFAGQPLAQGEAEITLEDPEGLELTEYGTANCIAVPGKRVLENLRKIQARNLKGAYPNPTSRSVFTVEMETGTGKTYVYLRTIFELHRMYGWKKFIIVVPSVAIREGVLKSIELMRDHFMDQYGHVPFVSTVYDSAQVSRVRPFATSNVLQILILNIQAFDKKDINVIYVEQDRMSGSRPLDFIESTRPIVILDEPQNMGSENRSAAIRSLNPLFELRYSATHRELVNLIYRLDPVQAYDLGLVKKIEVSSVVEEGDFNRPYLLLRSVSEKPITARIEIDVQTNAGPTRRTVTVRQAGIDLFDLSEGREQYRDCMVEDIDAGEGQVRLSNGLTLRVGEPVGSNRDEIMRAQIREAIKQHFEKERKVTRLPEGERMKVLSLFFIDRVANYAPDDGKIRRWFEEEYDRSSVQNADLKPLPVAKVHDGYFAKDGSAPKDSRGEGTTKADGEAYELIMKDKERLLSMDEPLRFIFSHSALKEGWDNPNVFQICTLNESRSEMTKRQQIGRGLRLPVRANGTRCFDPDHNRLTVVANESFLEFAKGLQDELKTDCGVEFGDRIKPTKDRRKLTLKKGWQLDENFRLLWQRIQPKTRYNIRFETDELVKLAGKELRDSEPILKPRILVRRGQLDMSYEEGVVGEETSIGVHRPDAEWKPTIPDMIGYLQKETELTRGTLARIIVESGRLKDAYVNPQQFLSQAVSCIKQVLKDFLVDGVEYEQLAGFVFEQHIFEDAEIEAYLDRLLKVDRSIYEEIEWESETEKKFAETLDKMDEIKLFIKLPRNFTVQTPVGTYNPDWAIVKEEDRKLCLIRETKGSTDRSKLRVGENAKVQCGKRHFERLGVDYRTVTRAEDV